MNKIRKSTLRRWVLKELKRFNMEYRMGIPYENLYYELSTGNFKRVKLINSFEELEKESTEEWCYVFDSPYKAVEFGDSENISSNTFISFREIKEGIILSYMTEYADGDIWYESYELSYTDLSFLLNLVRNQMEKEEYINLCDLYMI